MISKFETLPYEEESEAYKELNTFIKMNNIKREDIIKIEEDTVIDHEDNACLLVKMIFWGGNGEVTYGL